ncbi:LysR family transcriptional regulator [Thalassomonas viridans]|uniref:LysR family transcriptional regulator n=1 Tax=Thalassomonas viridans TaxID=137584 RepID=A0AAE9Z7I5_9GAMM|nr:LysR family transcriptional regulator [Thalassomonas viridans]WDE07429.1 LysR family transcriptional regulator [Thalassomonas viridans]
MQRYIDNEITVVHKSSMSWDDVQFFLSVARSGSARATAQVLGVSHSTVSRRMDNLESDLGTRLFDRNVGGYILTAEGKSMMDYAEQAEDALISAELHLHGRDNELSGLIRLTTPDVITNHILLPEIVNFTRKYPDIDIEFSVSSNVFELMRRESDIALRFMGFGNPPPEPLIGRKVASVASCFYASESYLAAHDLSDPDSGARWLGWGEKERFPQWVKSSPYPDIPTQYTMDQAGTQVEAVRAGLGMAMLPCFLADACEGLIRLPNCEPQLNHEIWLLSHPDLREVTRLRKFREFLVELFAQKQDFLAAR